MSGKASGVVSPPSSPEPTVGGLPSAPSFDYAALRALLVDVVAEQLKPINATIADLQDRVDDQSRAIPRFQPRPDEEDIAAEFAEDDEDDGTPQGLQETLADLKKGESRGGVRKNIPMTVNGRRVPRRVIEQTPPIFRVGQRIRLNPETAPPGAKDGVTWGTICAKHGASGIGVILKTHDKVGKRLYWVYRVYIPGIAQSPQIGFPIDEDQLLPAPRKARGAA